MAEIGCEGEGQGLRAWCLGSHHELRGPLCPVAVLCPLSGLPELTPLTGALTSSLQNWRADQTRSCLWAVSSYVAVIPVDVIITPLDLTHHLYLVRHGGGEKTVSESLCVLSVAYCAIIADQPAVASQPTYYQYHFPICWLSLFRLVSPVSPRRVKSCAHSGSLVWWIHPPGYWLICIPRLKAWGMSKGISTVRKFLSHGNNLGLQKT